MERRPPSDDDDNNRGGRGKVFGSEANRGRRGNANTDDAGNVDGETVEVFGGDVWSSGAVLALVIAWMFKAATERCTC